MTGLHENIGVSLKEFGGYFVCQNCGSKKEISKVSIPTSLEQGWPKCHGYTMTWITQKMLVEGSNQ